MSKMTYTDMGNLDLCQDYCTCGTPDPYNDGHTENCPMSLPIEVLREVEEIAPTVEMHHE